MLSTQIQEAFRQAEQTLIAEDKLPLTGFTINYFNPHIPADWDQTRPWNPHVLELMLLEIPKEGVPVQIMLFLQCGRLFGKSHVDLEHKTLTIRLERLLFISRAWYSATHEPGDHPEDDPHRQEVVLIEEATFNEDGEHARIQVYRALVQRNGKHKVLGLGQPEAFSPEQAIYPSVVAFVKGMSSAIYTDEELQQEVQSQLQQAARSWGQRKTRPRGKAARRS